MNGTLNGKRISRSLRAYLASRLGFLLFITALASATQAQTPTGPQQLVFAGLRSAAARGQVNAIATDAAGHLYLLLDEDDGVRLLKTDPAGTGILAQALLGGHGDVGVALALDPAGNLYVAGISTGTALGGTPGSAFPARADASTNSFVAKYDADLNNRFVTFAGGSRIVATGIAASRDAVFLTGVLFGPTLPVTPGVVGPALATGSYQNGFVERFSSDGSTLVYATYLSGAGGDTSPTAIASDPADNVFIAGSTTAPGYATAAALVPSFPSTSGSGFRVSGFLTKLAPAADSIPFSTFIPGAGITSLVLDQRTGTLLLSGGVDPGRFPIATAQAPLISTPYQALLRLPLDGSSVLASTLLAPGVQSFAAPAPDGSTWLAGSLTTPLLPLTALSTTGLAFAARVNSQGIVDQTARFGGLPTRDPGNASAPINLSSLAISGAGRPIFAGSFTPAASATLLSTERFDLPLIATPNALLPSTVLDAMPASCAESLCTGSAAWLAELSTVSPAPSLALSIGASPDVILRNLGSVEATGLQLAANGLGLATDCENSLPPGGECNIALTGSAASTLTAQAANASPASASLPAPTTSPTPIVFSPHELDFGVATAASAPTLRNLTVSNLSGQEQTFTSGLDTLPPGTSPFSQVSTDCTQGQGSSLYTLLPGMRCRITFALALAPSTPDGPLQAHWTVSAAGRRDVLLTGFAQAAALSLSAPEIAFGTRFPTTPVTPRYLYISNHSDAAISHAEVALPGNSPFTVTDRCPESLLPHSICQLQITYEPSASPSADSVTLALDAGLTALVTGESLPQASTGSTPPDPNLSITPSAIVFPLPVPVTTASPSIQRVTLRNAGTAPISIALTITGDFNQATSCPGVLAPAQSCSVLVTFSPTAPGPRTGILAIATGPSATPAYVSLSGTAAPILPPNNGTLDLGSVPVSQPTVRWFKISQALSHVQATSTGDFRVILVEDTGFGHGTPAPAAFQTTASGTCFNCFLGIQFQPGTPAPETGSLALASSPQASPYVLNLSGTGVPVTGPLFIPGNLDFGVVPVRSVSQPYLLALTNLADPTNPLSLSAPAITGDFTMIPTASGGARCAANLAPGATCFLQIAFAPSNPGPATGTLTIQTSTGPLSANLTGFAPPDPGLALSPNALTFENIPGSGSTQQTVTVTNTGADTLTIAPPLTSTPTFSATSTCAALAPASTCTIAVSFTPQAAPASSNLQLSVASSAGTSAVYTIPLTGAYTTQTAGLQIIPNQATFGPVLTGSIGVPRILTVNNLTSTSAALTFSMPREFAFTTPNPCPTLLPHGSCDFSITYVPATATGVTGTILAQGTPSDGSPTLNAFAYLAGYGVPESTSSLTVTGPFTLGSGVLDFGQLASGASTTRTLTVTNTGSTSATVRRITTAAPFLSTTTCLDPLAAGQSCTISIAYTPFNQVASDSSAAPATSIKGLLTIESDASDAPIVVDLTGSVVPVAVPVPSNATPAAGYTFSTGSVTFPATVLGSTSPAQSVTLTNTGIVPLHLTAMHVSGSFTITSTCTDPLPAGAACILALAFTPDAYGVSTGTLQLAADAPTSLDFITLYGTTLPPSLTLSPQTLDFGFVPVGSAASLPLVITNPATIPIPLGAVLIAGDYTVSGACPQAGNSLSPGATCTLQATFQPTAAGPRTGTLTLTSTPGAPSLTVPLTGIGTQAQLTFSPSQLAFGALNLGASATLPVSLANAGSAPLDILQLTGSSGFTVSSQCPTRLPSGSTCSASVTFAPTQANTRAGTLTVQTSDPSSPAIIPLTGSGIAPATFTLSIDDGLTASATIPSGTLASYTLTAKPVGSFSGPVSLVCSPMTSIPFATCSIAPSSVTLAGSSQSATLTIDTVANTTSTAALRRGSGLLCLIIPAGLFVLLHTRRPYASLTRHLLTVAVSFALLATAACGGSPNPNFRYVNPGTYQFQITATSMGTPATVQSVSATLTVTGNVLR